MREVLKGKNIIMGVSGGIAAYKAVEAVSILKKKGAGIDVIMTKNAIKFVSPLTFQTLSANPVVTEMFDEPNEWNVRHISLAQKAHLIIVAPATANIIGKIAGGIADDMLTTTIMASKAKVLLVPAMNDAMYENSIVQDNIKKLKKSGYIVMEPEEGILACGSTGKGRLPSPESIAALAEELLEVKTDMEGIKVLITAGPTREFLDPVRYLTNPSSGKMGYAVAKKASERGAEVRLVSGPVNIEPPEGVKSTIHKTAMDMYNEVMKIYVDFDVIILIAAVADYRFKNTSSEKIKKSDDRLILEMEKNPDIAKELGRVKGRRLLIGACAETENLQENALRKLEEKNLDIIMANNIKEEGAGFETYTNKVLFVRRDKSIEQLPLMTKEEVASRLLDEIRGIMI